MRPSIASLVGSLCIGLCLPVFYANGAASHPSWMFFGLIIGAGCYFLISFLMSRLGAVFSPRSIAAKQLFSLGYYAAPLLTYLLVLWMLKSAARH
jgi:hypothetical protein